MYKSFSEALVKQGLLIATPHSLSSTYTSPYELHTLIPFSHSASATLGAYDKKTTEKSNANNFHPGLRPTFLLEIALEMLKCFPKKVAQIFVQGRRGQKGSRTDEGAWFPCFPTPYLLLYLNDLSIVACASGIYIA